MTRRILSILALVSLAAILANIVYTRGFGTRLGGPPAKIEGAYLTEESWIVGEIARDVVEMSAYPAARAAASVAATEIAGTYRVSTGIAGDNPVALDLRQDLWAPAEFTKIARAALAPSKVVNATAAAATPGVHPALLDLTPAVLVAAATSISRALADNMGDVPAHEAAALTLGAFALRESAGRFNDTRWAMNRMTAHLAMAGAARAAVPPGIDGQLADAVLSVLKNQQTHALDILDALRTSRPSSAVDAWARALRLHITQDSRSIDAQARVSLLEKREYFRARRATIPWMIAQSDLAALSVDPRADWLRIVEAFGVNVEDGEMIEHGLAWEREEYEEVFSLIHGRAIGEHAADELNARATRCIGAAGPQVLPWGAWAELAQRHLAMFMSKSDNYYRHTLGAEATADTEKQRLKGELGALAMFPVATIFWTRGVRGGEADLGLINEAIAAAVGAPERMTPAPWSFLEYGAHYEPVRRGMPTPAVWFVAPAPRAAYEAGPRMKDGGHGLPEQVAVMMKNAPYDSALAGAFLKAKYADKPPAAEVRLAYGPRLEYDVRALRAARQFAEDDDAERLLLARRGCEVSAVECIALGHELENADRAYDTAASYERAFADPALDAIALSNASGWLVDYYRQHGRTDAALLLADRSAGTGSWQGMVTAGHLYENLGRFAEAKSLYAGVADRYEDPSQLLGFYYRAVTVRKQLELEPEWKTALARVFPNGLQPAQTDDGRPSRGVVVTKDNAKARKAGLQAGDIVIGLEGTRVDNLRQYYAVNAFSRREEMKLTVWRGKTFPVTATARNRMMGIEYRSYPIEGWRER